jgi:hypothetical protein
MEGSHMAEEAHESIHSDLEALLATTAQLFVLDGATREVAILANAEADLQWQEEDWGIDYFRLCIRIPSWLYWQISGQLEKCEETIGEKVKSIVYYSKQGIRGVSIFPLLSADSDWRAKAKSWLTGDGVSNQGRVRSDNIPSMTCDGLLFRSQNEIYLYKALKPLGISFAPLPVFVRGGNSYRRIEPDFVIIKSGVVLIVEVDGDTVHHETPAEAHNRTTMLAHEGVHIERVKASECATQELASECARRILQIIEKLKASR